MRRLVIILGFLLALGVIFSGCNRAPASPEPTPVVRFITVTPSSGGAGVLASPTFDGSLNPPSATPGPTSTPTPFQAPTPLPTSTPFNTPTAIVVTPTPAGPYAIINGPSGSVSVREAPGLNQYALGAYNNGAEVEIIGKQYSAAGDLWWLIPFASSPYGQGWIFADYTAAYGIERVPWVTVPTPPIPSPTPTRAVPRPPPVPHAIIDSPRGFVFVRSGPGDIYEPALGRFSNGRVVDVIGKQLSEEDQLWWLIPFLSGPNGGGWIYANDTIARYTDFVPWVTAPPTPTATATTPQPPERVDWTITGRVIEAGTGRAIAGAFVGATLGADGRDLTATTNANGEFIIVGTASDRGDLRLNVAGQGYLQRTLTAGPRSPRTYNFPAIELEPQEAPVVTWAIFGQVSELGTSLPVSGARVEALLGVDGVRLEAATGADGQFSMNGQARNRGTLSLNISADGYQSATFTSDQTDSRIYNLPNLQLVPLADSCRYESVIELSRASALARLQSLNFTRVSTQTVDVGGDQSLIDRVLTQQPDPPPEGQSVRVSCQIPITLGIGVGSAVE